jgi:hypothetical protein
MDATGLLILAAARESMRATAHDKLQDMSVATMHIVVKMSL